MDRENNRNNSDVVAAIPATIVERKESIKNNVNDIQQQRARTERVGRKGEMRWLCL
jgi:hypothetical protein